VQRAVQQMFIDFMTNGMATAAVDPQQVLQQVQETETTYNISTICQLAVRLVVEQVNNKSK